jgi:hypothetical protein
MCIYQLYIIDDDISESPSNNFLRKKSNTEALKPLISMSKKHAPLFKSKPLKGLRRYENIKDKKSKDVEIKSKLVPKVKSKLVFSSQEKARNTLASKTRKTKPNKLEKYLHPGAL